MHNAQTTRRCCKLEPLHYCTVLSTPIATISCAPRAKQANARISLPYSVNTPRKYVWYY